MNMKHLIGALVILTVFAASLPAQDRGAKLSLYGTVTAVEDGTRLPAEYAVLILQSTGLYATTDAKGAYRFENLDPGEYDLTLRLIGYAVIDTSLTLGTDTRCDFTLKESTFRLKEVSVVAERSRMGEATASKISRQAIDHSQTSSLKDLMDLLPGVELGNPNLSSTQTIAVRTASQTAMNSLGAAIIVDGAPVSNNANMEGINTAMTGVSATIAGSAVSSAGSIPNSGIDVRSISTDNIESIEIIRGIPSVQYGDLTSGAVIINSKTGVEPLMLKIKTDPKIWQAYISKGIKVGEKGGDLHLSADYAYSNAKTTESYSYYQRINAKALYSKGFRRLNTTSSLEFKFGKDTRNKNPDDFRSSTASGGADLGYRANTGGTWNINRGWIKTLRYDLSNSFRYKKSFHEQDCVNALSIYSTNMTDGTTVSNTKGRRIFDGDGNEITNFGSGQASDFATFMPYSYFSHYDFFGKELNTYAKVILNLHKSWKKTSERILAGADLKSDGNLGRGLVFPEGAPPLRSSNAESGYRERPLYDIPFVNQTGLFAESTFKTEVLNRDLSLTGGLRYDRIGHRSSLSPRINASVTLIPDALWLRGGYGLTSKAPTSAYLHPNNAYYDQSNYNSLDAADEKNRLVLATTYVFDTRNPKLEIARNRKAEIGFDLKFLKKCRLAVTFFDELMKNGYDFDADFSSIHWMPYRYYSQTGSDANGNPVLSRTTDTHKFFTCYIPANNAWQRNYGIEYELNLGRFDAIRTSFFLNGAWMRTENTSTGCSFDVNAVKGSTLKSHVAVYEPGTRVYEYEKALSTLRVTHNIPSIGFVATLTSQLSLFTKNWTEYHNETRPSRYISNADGKVYPFTAEMADDPAFSYMLDPLSESRFITERHRTTLVFNLNVSKEIRNFLTASFYVNNVFNSRPLDPSEVTKGNFTELNNPMYFGFELKIKL